jgi:hypothetical protein
VRQLLDEGGTAIVNAADEDGRTALILAARSGATFLVEALLEKGADQHAADKMGRTALIWAVIEGRALVVKKLVKSAGNDILELKHQVWYTPLSRSASRAPHRTTWARWRTLRYSHRDATPTLLAERLHCGYVRVLSLPHRVEEADNTS